MKKEHVILCAALLFALMLPLSACTDYEGAVDEKYEEWKASIDVIPSEAEGSISYGTLMDARDNRAYKTVTIGTQTWMAENLNYAYNDSSAKSVCYDNKSSNCDKYGRLYTWADAMTACPEGWHLPSDKEWNILFDEIGGADFAGTKLKSNSGWYNGYNGLNFYGFAVLPAGRRDYYGKFDFIGNESYFWNSTEEDSDYAYYSFFYYKAIEVVVGEGNKRMGLSVRCLMASNDGDSSASSFSSQTNLSNSSAKSSSSANVIPSEVEKSSSSVKDGSKYDAIAKTLTDLRDNQTYKIVTIGTQTWMAENLNYDYNKGTAKSYCYDDKTSNCDKYGRLYTWAAAMDPAAVFSTAGEGCGYGKTCSISGTVRGVCPEGWHLPNDDEWNTLFTAVGGNSTAGRSLKSSSGWYNSGNGTDAFGFAVLPAGYRFYDGYFNLEGYDAYFWSSTELNSDSAYGWNFNYNYELVFPNYYSKNYGASVRCLRDSNDEGDVASSSSSQVQSSSSSAKSSSSAASSSSAKSNSSSSVILSSSSEESSSSLASSSSAIKVGYDAASNTLTDARDNQIYKTVTIGTQTWMAENLNIGKMQSGNSDQSDDFQIERYCYDDETTNCDKYGGLYQWAEAMQLPSECNQKSCADQIKPNHQGICPDGWRLPDDDDWNALFTAVGGTDFAGTKLKSTSGWESSGSGTDDFGFAVLPAGYRYSNGDFHSAGSYADFWSSTEGGSNSAYNWYFNYSSEDVDHYGYKSLGFSVRCIRDSN